MNTICPFARTEFPSARTRGAYSYGHPRGAIVHFTAGHPQQRLQDAIDWQVQKGYTYFVIDHEGHIAQNFPLTQWGYHAGDTQKYPSSWPSLGFGVSDQCVGIEVCCPGKLTKHRAPNFSNTPYSESLCRQVAEEANREGGWYYKFAEAQESALIRLLLWLKSNAPDVFGFEHVLGHDEVSGPRGLGWRRKNDPGGSLSWTMDAFRVELAKRYAALRARGDEAEEPVQQATDLLPELVFRSLRKDDWFHANRDALVAMVRRINERQQGATPLTLRDVGGLLNAELGLDAQGRVDPNHVHSLGERGPLPLPESLRYWLPDAKPAKADRSPHRNVYDFLRYLHAVKNKDVGREFAPGQALYRDLFALPGVRDDEAAQTRLLAAVIHGWFLPSNYTLRLPMASIAYAAVNAGDQMADIIADLGFKHGRQLLANRLTNLDQISLA